ncbi:hypothetical protein POTOM_050339 [Populus tomentosa]|uniref:BHLH domain-containing protein n=1 Tax=Populus tomentosa TaxID=118781 RepID=A0A8X7Y7Y4_POPTO|nr:hypothetical protein POTOM_050339 [Populus tomentosa]
MELPQQRPFGTEGRKPTHDFLSLYSHSSTVQQDPRPPSQGGFLQTHDFLEPLEQVSKATAREETNVEILTIEKPPPPAPPPSVEHILPGGIGTYSISHVSYFNQRVPKPENTIFSVAQASSTDKNDENSNCSSYSASGFTLWEESALKKGKTGKENVGERSNIIRGPWFKLVRIISCSCYVTISSVLKTKGIDQVQTAKSAQEAAAKTSQWTTSERPSQSSSSNHRNSFSSLSSSQSTTRAEMYPELHRNDKVGQRFQMLRALIPHGDQKRDKASFLLEVIEHVQFLQEKVQKYEGSYQGWNHEHAKLGPWRNNSRPVESSADQSRGVNSGVGPALLFATNLDEKNITISPSINPGGARNAVESNVSSARTFNAMDHHPNLGITNKAMPFPISLQPNLFHPGRIAGAAAQFPPRLAFDAENTATQPQPQPQPQPCHAISCTSDGAVASDKLKQQNLTVEGGTISISSAYSQGLLNTLTQALQSSGVDMSQASISVQIELGKKGNSRQTAPASIVKDNNAPPSNQGTIRSRVSSGEESDQALKKLKTSKR